MTTQGDTDWVRARAEAPVFTVFRRLVAGATKDVAIRRCLRLPDDTFRLEVTESADTCTVSRLGGNRPAQVRFIKGPHGIEAVGDGFRLRGTLTLDGQGQCRLHVDGVPTEEWHFRQMALEALFFDAPMVPAGVPVTVGASAKVSAWR